MPVNWNPGPSPPPDARLDLGRRTRLGMVEAIWGEHKSVGQITAILRDLHRAGELGLVTRVSEEKAAAVQQELAILEQAAAGPPMQLQHHREARSR